MLWFRQWKDNISTQDSSTVKADVQTQETVIVQEIIPSIETMTQDSITEWDISGL